MLSLTSAEQMVPARHPLRKVKKLADAALADLDEVFEAMYSNDGRKSIPPEQLLKASLLMALYSVRSERLFCEQLGYNLLFKWFLDLDIADAPFDPSTFSKNRERLLAHDVSARFFSAVVAQARKRKLMSHEHFSVDGTLIEAYASMKSFRPKDEDDDDQDGNGWANFKGEKRSNKTHASKTDPDARLIRKGRGKEAKLAFIANALMENRNGLLVDIQLDFATGRAERDGALEMLENLGGESRVTLGADAGYDTREFATGCKERNVTPHVTQNKKGRRSAIDGRTTRHAGYEVSQRIRRQIEGIFGWLKSAANMRKSRWRGRRRTELALQLTAAAYNLIRIAKLSPA